MLMTTIQNFFKTFFTMLLEGNENYQQTKIVTDKLIVFCMPMLPLFLLD